MKQKIKNAQYRKFLDEGMIETLSEEQIGTILSNIKDRAGRALVIFLYYTGARPAEALEVKAKDIKKERSLISIKVPAKKRGLPRTIYLQLKLPLVQELFDFASSQMDEIYIFYKYKNKYIRSYINKKGEHKTREETTDKLRYWFNLWFAPLFPDGLPPYFLRHNRFTKLAESGLDMYELKQLKGARDMDSIMPYLHFSSHLSKKVSKKIR